MPSSETSTDGTLSSDSLTSLLWDGDGDLTRVAIDRLLSTYIKIQRLSKTQREHHAAIDSLSLELAVLMRAYPTMPEMYSYQQGILTQVRVQTVALERRAVTVRIHHDTALRELEEYRRTIAILEHLNCNLESANNYAHCEAQRGRHCAEVLQQDVDRIPRLQFYIAGLEQAVRDARGDTQRTEIANQRQVDMLSQQRRTIEAQRVRVEALEAEAGAAEVAAGDLADTNEMLRTAWKAMWKAMLAGSGGS